MSKNRICAYIDILGFKEIINTDINGAIQLISDYQEILKIKKMDESMFKEQYEKEEKDMNLKSLFDKSIIDSFEYFIPFSDSVFIIASDISKLIFQISNFFIDSFIISGHQFADLHVKKRKDLLQVTSKTKWYPLLFKGGLSFGECVPYKNYQVSEFKLTQNYNLVGKAVAEAVKYEKIDKGPRLFCSRQFYNVITNNESTQIVVPTENHKETYEILWPMPYIKRKGINGYQNLLEIGLNLWLYFNHMEYGIHYFRLLELIIKSIMETYKNNPSELSKGFDVISDKFSRKSVDITKIKHILEEYKS